MLWVQNKQFIEIALEIKFEKICGTDAQIRALYDLLYQRKHTISHRATTDYEDHKSFVLNNPYRTWYLVKSGQQYLGSIYLTDTNCIGLNINTPELDVIQTCLNFLTKTYPLLPEVKSVTPPYYYVNIPAGHTHLENIMKTLEWKIAQTSFIAHKTGR